MTRAFTAAAALLLCAACTHHPAPSATQAAATPPIATPTPQTGDDIQQAYHACLDNTAADIDNGHGEPIALAEAVAATCHPQYLQYADINERPYAPKAQPEELQAAAAAIQAHRKSLAAK